MSFKMYDLRKKKGWENYNFRFPMCANISMTEKQGIFLDKYAEKMMTSRQSIFRLAVQEFLEKHEKELEK